MSSPEVNARIQIAGELARLAQQRASGALEISSGPGGTIFLSGGYLAFAEAPIVPDLRSRLISSQRLSADEWRAVTDGDRMHGGIGTLLVSREILTINELRSLLRSIALDALVALVTMPSTAELPAAELPAAEPAAADIRFWPRRSHWVGSLLRLDVASVWADVEQRAGRLTTRGILADACPRLTDLERPWAVIRGGQWVLACQSDGQTTVKDLAWRNGFPLCDALDWVGDLVQAGLCNLAPSATPSVTPASSPASPPPVTSVAAAEPEPRERRPLHRPRFGDRRARQGGDQDRPGQGSQLPARSGSGKEHGAHKPANGAAQPAPAIEDPAVPLPHRSPGATLAARANSRSGRARPPEATPRLPAVTPPPQPPHPDLWHRILKGLKRIE